MTDPDLLIFGAGREVLAVRAEADAANVEIAILIDVLILQRRHLLARLHVVDLRRAVAARGQVLAIAAEANAADHAVMSQVMHQVHIQHALHFGVEHCEPIRPLSLLV